MASDLIQRAAAICGYPFTPNSDQLAAWLDEHLVYATINSSPLTPTEWWVDLSMLCELGRVIEMPAHTTLLEALAAAVVEVDRIEREAKQP